MTVAQIDCMGVVGVGVMGAGIAQVAAQAGVDVLLFDVRPGAAAEARDALAVMFDRLAERGKMTAEAAASATTRLHVAQQLGELARCDLIVEAIVERLDVKQSLFIDLEAVVRADCILATNTSSLSVTAIAQSCRLPERIAGFHFFNPVPLMKVVEVIDGLATDPAVGDRLLAFAGRLGHRGVRTKDMPGFLINHAGRAYGTEGLKMLGESIAPVHAIDRILREAAGFRMGPFELFDLTGLDVSHPVMESIYGQFFQEPRYRPSPLTRQMLDGGQIGRKAGRGFYSYQQGVKLVPTDPDPMPPQMPTPPVWIHADNEEDRAALVSLVTSLSGVIERGPEPPPDSLCVLAPYGRDATEATLIAGSPGERSVCIDMLLPLDRHRTLMTTPATLPSYAGAAQQLFSTDGIGATLIGDSVGFVIQRTLAAIVNLACDIAQQSIATVDDIDLAVKLGLGYPRGPLEWGDELGPRRLLLILSRMLALTGDARYRPSPWLRRRAALGLSLRHA